MSWLARPGSGAYLWSERWSQYRPVPTERGKNSNQELELEKGGPRQALQWVSANCWSRLTSPHSARRGLDLKSHFFPAWAKRESQLEFPFPNRFIFLMNLLPATPGEHLSNKTLPPLLELKKIRIHLHVTWNIRNPCLIFATAQPFLSNAGSYIITVTFSLTSSFLKRLKWMGDKKCFGNTAYVCFSIVFSSQSSEISRKS